jgi:methanogenic corrinoid protein MtbC1
VSPAFAEEIGADGHARDATLAVVRAKELSAAPVAASG